jgi:tetratricopeptide (TPR) repeat protein
MNRPAATLPPLHEYWPKALAYPAQPAAASTVVAIAAAHAGALLVPVLGGLLDLVVWAAFFKYAFEVLRWSANGRAEAPEISLTVGDMVGRYAVLLLVLIELAIVLVGASAGPVAALALGLVLMLALPAMVTILALEEGFVRALNPFAWLLLGARIGRVYFALAGFFCAALVVQSLFALAVASALPGFVADALSHAVVSYLLLAGFHLIGCVIHEQRDALGYSGHLALQPETPHTDPARRILDAARTRAAGGDTLGAAQLLREELAAQPDALPLHDELRHWLRQNDANDELLGHAKKYIPVLLAQNRERRAMEVVRECQAIDPKFALDDPAAITRLAHAAADAGHTQLALGLLAGFHKRFRNHPDLGRNYLLAAKLWAERMNKEMQARALLQQLKLSLPNDPVMPQVDAYLAFLDRLAATPPRSGNASGA